MSRMEAIFLSELSEQARVRVMEAQPVAYAGTFQPGPVGDRWGWGKNRVRLLLRLADFGDGDGRGRIGSVPPIGNPLADHALSGPLSCQRRGTSCCLQGSEASGREGEDLGLLCAPKVVLYCIWLFLV